MDRIAAALKEVAGPVLVAGHTDSVPIENVQFRSNWELSAARAASVAHVFLNDELIPSPRVHLEAYADTHPLDTNDSSEGRVARSTRTGMTGIPRSSAV